MPSRLIREEIITSDAINSLSPHAELLYRRLLNIVEDYGRFDARPNIVRLRCYPLQIDRVRESDVARWMAECHKAGAIVLYEVGGKPYLVIPKVQRPRADVSKIPEPPANVFCWRPNGKQPYEGELKTDENICAQLNASAINDMQMRPYSDSDSKSDSNSPLSPPEGGGRKPRRRRDRRAEVLAEAGIQ